MSPTEQDHDLSLVELALAEVDGELLEHLHRYWMAEKGRPMGAPRANFDVGDVEPGDLVGFEEVFDDERLDECLLDDHRYLADTFFCPDPACSCRDARVVFIDLEQDPETAVGSVLVDLARSAGAEVLELTPEEGAPCSLVSALWDRFVARHRVRSCLGRRLQRVRAASQLHRPRPTPVRVEEKPGRNDPCPCGSGRKYKRCCANKTPAR